MKIADYVGEQASDPAPPAPLRLSRVRSYEGFQTHIGQNPNAPRERAALELSLLSGSETLFSLPGYCYLCDQPAGFNVHFRHRTVVDGRTIPIWRETVGCRICKFSNRTRAAVHIMETVCAVGPNASIYMTEQTTPMFRWFTRNYPNVQGSEFLGDRIPRGAQNDEGLRNEDVTRLTFSDAAFDSILSFDVLEHVPDYRAALRECFRCLKPGGSFLLSVPFARNSERNIVRAVMEDGQIRHLLPPEYHGDPLNPDGGCLCFYHFGWELLDEMRTVGFADATAILYWSPEYGYLGGEQIIFFAHKPK